MHTHKRARTLAIQIQIADMKLFTRAMQLCFVATVDGSGETKLRVVRDLECVVVVLCLDHCQHWTKDFFLLDRRTCFHVRYHSRLNKESLFAIRTTTRNHTSTFTLPF